jgi:hypothetical protein
MNNDIIKLPKDGLDLLISFLEDYNEILGSHICNDFSCKNSKFLQNILDNYYYSDEEKENGDEYNGFDFIVVSALIEYLKDTNNHKG